MAGGDRLDSAVRSGLRRSEGRQFGLTLGIAFGVITAIFVWRGHHGVAWVLGSISAIMLLGGIVVPDRLGPVQRAWMGLALAISKVTTPIFMSIVWVLVLTPAGLIMRLVGRNPMRREPIEAGFWVRRERTDSDLERQF